jgi:OOP family OmpA-OmpF porin
MTILKTVLTSAVVIGLGACSSFQGNNEVEMLDNMSAVGSPFTQQLTSEYRAFSSFELDNEKDYADALHFARKGMDAAKGMNVMPEPVNDWDLTQADMVELSTAYGRMVSAIDRGAREIIPGKTAIAQARYDCWIEEQEEVANGMQMSVPCKADFMAVMTEVEAALPAAIAQQAEEFPAPVSMIDSNEPLNIQEAMYLVFFDFDGDKVNSDGRAVIDAVTSEVQSRNIDSIRIVGHTDTSGSATYNARLANKRANDVKAELVSRGVPAGMIMIEGRGENELLVNTTDGVREPANRRAVITFE